MKIEDELKKWMSKTEPRYILRGYREEITEMTNKGYSKTQILDFFKSLGIEVSRKQLRSQLENTVITKINKNELKNEITNSQNKKTDDPDISWMK